MIQKTICVLGGSGFVGHQLVSQLSKAGYVVRIPSRNRERRRSIMVLPNVEITDVDINDEEALKGLFSGCDAVINLAAILNEQATDTFKKLHVELAQKVVNACRATGVTRLLHMSALNADAKNGSSAYLRSKGEGEDLVHGADDLQVTSFRPAVMFGWDDHFFTRLDLMMRYLPVMPVFCPEARMAPVYVEDVVTVMMKSLTDKTTIGQRFDLCGPEAFTMLELTQYTRRLTKAKTILLPMGPGLSALHGRILGILPFKVFTHDNFLSLQTPAICKGPFPEQFGIVPKKLDMIVPKYIGRKDIRGRYDEIRRKAARDPEV